MRLHHVQLSCPPGAEDRARVFWRLLGLVEVDKPAELRGRGGAWFRAYDDSGAVIAEIHVGVEEPFVAAAKAHPALLVEDLDATAARLRAAGFDIDDSQRDTFPPYHRLHTRDPHGNRVELLAERD